MRLCYIESHPKDDQSPPGWFVFGESELSEPSDWTRHEVKKALGVVHGEGGISTIVPPLRDVLSIHEPRAHLFVGFDQVEPSDAADLARWVDTLLPGVEAKHWGDAGTQSRGAIALALLNQQHPPQFFVGTDNFQIRVDAIATARPIWIDDHDSALGRSLHLQPVTLVFTGGCVIAATHSTGVGSIDSRDGNTGPPTFRGAITSGPDPGGTPGFLSAFVSDLVDDYGSATRELMRALDGWESEFFAHVADTETSAEQRLTFGKLREIQRGSVMLEAALVQLQQEELRRVSWYLKPFEESGGMRA